MNPPIVLLTDFGLKDHYVGTMKGIILSIAPQAPLVDLSHEIDPQNMIRAALILDGTYAYFPKGSIFVCVVDPGVGTSRKMIAVQTKNYFFLAPDNGVLGLVLRHEEDVVIRSIENQRYFLCREPSATFHGRDVFAPVAANLAIRKDTFSVLGPEVKNIHPLRIPKVKKTKSRLSGEVLYFDHFGNAITNIRRYDSRETFWKQAEVNVKRHHIGNLCSTYADGAKGLKALFNSSSHLEIAWPNGSARVKASLKIGDGVIVQCIKKS